MSEFIEEFLNELDIARIIRDALDAVIENIPTTNPCRSRAFVKEMAHRFRCRSEIWNPETTTNFAQRLGGPGEVGYDISVDAMRDKVVATSVLQVESEFAATLSKNRTVTLRRAELYRDFNKLVRGSARTRIMLTSMEWLVRYGEYVLPNFAFGMRDQSCTFFLAFVPFPEYWSTGSSGGIRLFRLTGQEFLEFSGLGT